MKKPLNMIEGPVYPDIKKGPPRFQWSGKHWNVDTGATLRDTEHINQFYEPAILAQSRDYNKTVYGQSSHKDVVNAAFRPPLLDPYEDFYPLTRIPVTTHAIIPHINPHTAGHDGGTSGFSSKNERSNDIEKSLTDRIKDAEWRPTFYCPIDAPIDNAVLPDLELKLPAVSASAGFVYPTIDAPNAEVNLNFERLNPLMDAGVTTQVRIDAPNAMENMELETKLDTEFFTNPGTADAGGYRSREDNTGTAPDDYIMDKRPTVSYVVPAEQPTLRSQNVITHQPKFRERLQPVKSYGRINHASAIPRMGLDVPGVRLKSKIMG